MINCGPVPAATSRGVFMAPCPLIFPLKSLGLENVTVHKAGFSMFRNGFPLEWGMFVKEVSEGIEILMAKKTSSFVRMFHQVRLYEICFKIMEVYFMNFADTYSLIIAWLFH